jgi:hypothetical protein
MRWNKRIAIAAMTLLGLREDAHETAVLARQLDYVQAQTYDIQYTTLKSRQYVPEANDVPAGAKTFTYRQWDRFGIAKIIHDYANDFEAVGVFAKEFTNKLEDVGSFYQYSIADMEAAAFAGIPLDTKQAEAVRLSIDLAFDNIIALGSPDVNLPGFLNHPNVPLVVLPHGDWQNASRTAQEVLADMRYLASQVVLNTLEVHAPDTMLLDSTSYEFVAGTAIGQNYDRTILSVFLATNPHIKYVDQWTKLNTASATGGARIMVYKRDPAIVQCQIPIDFQQLPVQQEGAVFKTYCRGRCGGTVWHYPLAAAYADNADNA